VTGPRMRAAASRGAAFAACALIGALAVASQSIPDKYPGSVLYDRPREVVPGVWSAIGATGPPSYENSGHNNNLSFVVTSDGVLVVNGGACYLLAKALHDEIRKVTDQPVKLVVDENAQGHAMLGNSYWAQQGVPIVMHADAAAELAKHGHEVLARMRRYNRDKAEGTTVVAPTETFEGRKLVQMGDTRIELISFGPAHSPGDISVWLPDKDLIISGDMAFHERLLPIFEDTVTKAWLESWDRFAAMKVTHVIPGHGAPTDMAEVTRYTRDYLVYLRGKVRALLDAGGSLAESYAIDQSPFAHLDTFKELAARNAERVFREMEFE
jgi:glyoxylase-like metal-dependent hydrolase (beta-lactamase superfamily II)